MKLSEKVFRVITGEKISPKELAFMVESAAITSVPGFNRRYFQWLFKIQGDNLLDMQFATRVEVGHGRDKVYEQHEDCDGKGCKKCGWSGEIVRKINDKPIPRHQSIHHWLRN